MEDPSVAFRSKGAKGMGTKVKASVCWLSRGLYLPTFCPLEASLSVGEGDDKTNLRPLKPTKKGVPPPKKDKPSYSHRGALALSARHRLLWLRAPGR